MVILQPDVRALLDSEDPTLIPMKEVSHDGLGRH